MREGGNQCQQRNFENTRTSASTGRKPQSPTKSATYFYRWRRLGLRLSLVQKVCQPSSNQPLPPTVNLQRPQMGPHRLNDEAQCIAANGHAWAAPQVHVIAPTNAPQRGSYSRRPVGAPNALRRFSSGRLINRS